MLYILGSSPFPLSNSSTLFHHSTNSAAHEKSSAGWFFFFNKLLLCVWKHAIFIFNFGVFKFYQDMPSVCLFNHLSETCISECANKNKFPWSFLNYLFLCLLHFFLSGILITCMLGLQGHLPSIFCFPLYISPLCIFVLGFEISCFKTFGLQNKKI